MNDVQIFGVGTALGLLLAVATTSGCAGHREPSSTTINETGGRAGTSSEAAGGSAGSSGDTASAGIGGQAGAVASSGLTDSLCSDLEPIGYCRLRHCEYSRLPMWPRPNPAPLLDSVNVYADAEQTSVWAQIGAPLQAVTLTAVDDSARAVTLDATNRFEVKLPPDYFVASEPLKLTPTPTANGAAENPIIEAPPRVTFTATPAGWSSSADAATGGAPVADLRSGTLRFEWQSAAEGELEVVYRSGFWPDAAGETLTATCRVPLNEHAFTLPAAIAEHEKPSFTPDWLTISAISEHSVSLTPMQEPVLVRAVRGFAGLAPARD